MSRCHFFLALFTVASISSVATMHAAAADSKPNVVFILADDLGWSDTTLFNTTKLYRTPNIERLAARGMLFSRAYSSSPLCSPTRASILTGLSPARIGITAPTCHLPKVQLVAKETQSGSPKQHATIPESATRFNTSFYTLAEALKDNGYTTGHFGKWHLGPEPYSPLEHGFDVDIPHWPGPGPAGSYVAPWKYPDFDPATPKEHIEDRMAQEAVAFLEKHQHAPFFLNYWMFSVHAPFDAKQELIDSYKKVVDPSDSQRSPTYAAMIESMDDAIGTLLDTLDRLKLSDHTIVVFASDNGGNMYNQVDGTTATSNTPLKGGKATMYEGGVRGPAIIAAPGVVAAGSKSDEIIQSSDFYPTLLEMLSIAPQPDQLFDGISLLPALGGQSLQRDGIFTYFPHSPGIPDWLPPAVSIHEGAWKLIRIFHSGENKKHRYMLFDLNEDLGEQKNLADQFPDQVRRLDQKIEAFLERTGAARPLPNPNFDPTTYDPELEGKASLKRTGSPAPKRQRAPGKPVAGWTPSASCHVSVSGGKLVIHSIGGDPFISSDLPVEVEAQTLVLTFSMSSDSTGSGQVFWKQRRQPFSRERSQGFNAKHTGQPNDVAVEFSPADGIAGLRIDPSTSEGQIELSDLKLSTPDGKLVYRWDF